MGDGQQDAACNWAACFLEHHRGLTAYAISLVGFDAAGDLVQDVLLSLVDESASLDGHDGAVGRASRPAPPRDERAYLMRCLRNRAIDWRRRARVRPGTTSLCHASPALFAIAPRDAAARELAEAIAAALSELSPAQREVIVLRVYGGLSFQQVAEALELPLGTVASHYSRGTAALRTMLEGAVP